MRYTTEELEKMPKEKLVETYRNVRRGEKRKILINLANSYKFSNLVNGLDFIELMQMSKIHPFKEVIVDTMMYEMELGNTEIAKKWKQQYFSRKDYKIFGLRSGDNVKEVLKRGNILDRIKEFFTQKSALPDTFLKKVEKVDKLSNIVERKNNATGKKIEATENQPLDQAVDKSRVEVNNGEMAKIFDSYAKKALKKGQLEGIRGTTPVGQQLKLDLAEEYKKILGTENENLAKLIARKEYESYSGENFFMPYTDENNFRAKHYREGTLISGSKDNRGWKKNLLEIEQVEDFTVQDHNFGEVFIVKSEFSPTSYAINKKWAPIYEYYTKNENGELIRIGSGKINAQTGKMETTISLDGDDWQEMFKVSGSKDCDLNEEFKLAKEQGTIMIFDSSEYTGKSTKTSRKDIEKSITSQAIQEYLNKIYSGKKTKIVDITQVKDLQQDNSETVPYGVAGWETVSKLTTNIYLINSVIDGKETCEMVTIDVDGKCKPFLEMKKDMFSDKEISFQSGLVPAVGGKIIKGTPQLLTKKSAIEKFKSKDGVEYAVYRDDSGKLRMGQLVDFADDSGTYVEELDTYSLMHEDAKKATKEQKQEKEKEQEQEQSKTTKDKEEENER